MKRIYVSPRSLFAFACAAAVMAASGRASACKYSVRDVAFVDLGVRQYQLLIFERGSRSRTLADKTAQVAANVLPDVNVTLSVVDLNDQPRHPALALLAAPDLERLPFCILVSPDGRALLLEWDLPADVSVAVLQELITSVVQSPRRAEIMQNVLTAHSVILLINGDDASVHVPVRQAVQRAVRQVRESLDLLPKPIANPPHVIAMKSAEAAEEQILLWSLGVEPPGKDEARVVVLLGRGRIIGPPVTFPGNNAERQLLTNLAAVGQDCECGLDRSWMAGQMMPHVWSAAGEAEAMKELGFDPGDPLVKAEVSRILERGPDPRRSPALSPEPNVLLPGLGYREIVLDDAPERPADARPDDAKPAVAAPGDTTVQDPSGKATELVAMQAAKSSGQSAVAAEPLPRKPHSKISPTGESSPSIIFIVLSAIGLVALTGAVLILVRRRRGASA